MRNIVAIIVAMVLCTLYSSAQGLSHADPVETKIYFRLGESEIDLNYKDNRVALESFVEEINGIINDPDLTIKRIVVTGSSSPEGNSVYNQELSDKRTESLYRWVVGFFPQYRHLTQKNSIGVDWEQLISLVESSYVPYKSRVLDILQNTPIWIRRGGRIVDGRVKQLKDLDDGHVWRYMYSNFFSEMRMAGGGLMCEVEHKVSEVEEDPSIVISSKRSLVVVNGDTTSYTNNDVFNVIPKDTIHLVYKDTIRITNDSEKFQQVIEETINESQKVRKPKEKRSYSGRGFVMAAKTNLLYDAALVPNVGIEFHLGSGWSIGANWMYAWWSLEEYSIYHRVYGGDLYLRKYFPVWENNPLSGHHIGLYGQIVSYDLAYAGKGQMADDFNYGVGFEYGYSFPVAKCLNVDLSVGAGYLTGEYETYISSGEKNHYVWQSTYLRRWLGPTKAEVSLVWIIGGKNNK